uniref:Toxin of RelEStbE family n=1 Tax=Marseillevirus sp. TaxID=2809551 RepID=A0AA96ER06_9VIRU|nr:toxin of RelEStbE family [Marseillevirus sp.]
MNPEDVCERFNSFLSERKEGTHFFIGNLRGCSIHKNVETEGRYVVAAEDLPCHWHRLLNVVTILGEKDQNKTGRFYLDERCIF